MFACSLLYLIKMKMNEDKFLGLAIRSGNFWQNAPSNYVLFNCLFVCVAVSNASRSIKFCEIVGTFGIINVMDSLLQNITTCRIVCLCLIYL